MGYGWRNRWVGDGLQDKKVLLDRRLLQDIAIHVDVVVVFLGG